MRCRLSFVFRPVGGDGFQSGADCHDLLFTALKFLLVLALVALPVYASSDHASQCYGTVARGRIDGAVALPEAGKNFQSYSTLGITLGRTYVHSTVRDVVLTAYSVLERILPNAIFVYGETGAKSGGHFRPHRTHQNGLSVDFMVPVLDKIGRSVPLPTNALNKFGYSIVFDAKGRYDDYRIDFDALAEHLYQLHVAASERGIKIGRVIIEPEYHAKLFATKHGALVHSLPLMKKSAWVRHDNHYHIDFVVPCLPSEP